MPLHDQWIKARRLPANDLDEGCGDVEMPFALDVEYPKAGPAIRVPERDALGRRASRRR